VPHFCPVLAEVGKSQPELLNQRRSAKLLLSFLGYTSMPTNRDEQKTTKNKKKN
jgi:hypothetical protein